MISRSFTYALLISLFLHVAVASTVVIVTPDDMIPSAPYTRVDFLGPILRKAAFEILLEDRSFDFMAAPRAVAAPEMPMRELDRTHAKKELALDDRSAIYPAREERRLRRFLVGRRTVAASLTGRESPLARDTVSIDSQEPVFRPEPPAIPASRFPGTGVLSIRARVLIGLDGSVERAEPLNTTGHAELDQIALEYVKRWIFRQPSERTWEEVVVELRRSR